MNTNWRCLPVLCAMAILLTSTLPEARAQRVRFESGFQDSAAVNEGMMVASRPASVGADPLSSSVVAPSAAPITPIATSDVAYGQSIAPTLASASAWDPYQVASRRARFTGLISSAPGGGLLPQPMPRVPYYTQQPIVNTSQPYVVLPEGAPLAPAPIAPAPASTVLPGATPPGMIVPSTVPTLGTLTAPPPPMTLGGQCYAQADAIFFTRDARVGNNVLVLDGAAASLNDFVALTTADLGFGFEVGPRITLGRSFDGFRAIEGTYFGIYNFQDSFSFSGAPGQFAVVVPGVPGGYAAAEQISIDYDSQVQNAEINYLQHYGNVAWLVGFRYFLLGEKFAVSSVNGVDTSDSRVSVYNNLFGGQIGGRISQSCGRWSYDLTGKAGVYGNAIHTSQRSIFEGATLIDQKTTGSRVSFIGELGLNGNYELNPNWSVRGGYQVYWIEGVALAPNQIDYTGSPTPGLSKNGGVFLQGAHAGLMARW